MLFDALRRMFALSGPAGSKPDLGTPGSPLARGTAALERGRVEEAIAAFGEAFAIAGDADGRAAALNKRGVANVTCGRRERALADFLAALAEVPRFSPALVNVGNMLLEDGDFEDAIDYYDAAVRADERYAPAYRHRGIAHKRAGRFGAGVRDLRVATKLEATASADARRRRSNSAPA
jgi:tetratricopeptide (TPR) repeat protein